MAAGIEHILKSRLQGVLEGGDRLQLRLQPLLDEPFSLSPWNGWLLLSLIRHRGRQQFLLENMKYRLDGDPDAIANVGALGHPERARVGLVPGDADWEYRFHGRGCCMTHRGTGEVIDVDFFDDTADWITPYFFVNFLQSLRSPKFVEQRMQVLYPSPETVSLGFSELMEHGLLERQEFSQALRLCGDWEPLCDMLDEIEQQWSNPAIRTLLAAALSDWIMLPNEIGRGHEQSKHCFEQRFESLKKTFLSGSDSADALIAMADLNSPDLDECLEHALAGAPDRVMSCAIRIVGKQASPQRWLQELGDIIERIDPNGQLPAPHIWVAATNLLLESGVERSWEELFSRIESSSLGEASLCAMEHNLPFALSLVRKSLRSHIPINRIEIAAALAIIDQPWCHDELASVLADTTDQEKTTECRSALLESRSTEVHSLVHDWEAKNPYSPPSDKHSTIGELAKQRDDSVIQYEMQCLHDRVLPLRASFRPQG